MVRRKKDSPRGSLPRELSACETFSFKKKFHSILDVFPAVDCPAENAGIPALIGLAQGGRHGRRAWGPLIGRSEERLSFSGKEFGDGDKVPIHMPYVPQME